MNGSTSTTETQAKPNRRRRAALVTVAGVVAGGASMIGATLLSGSQAHAMGAPIHTTATVNIRPGASTSSGNPIGSIPQGASPDFVCWTQGQNINGVDVWFKVNFGGVTGFYASYYDDSSYPSDSAITSKYGIPNCASVGTPVPPPAPAPTPAPAPSPHAFGTMNASGGIYWRSGPDWNTPVAQSGNGVYPDSLISVSCYQMGAANVPGSSDAMWVQASTVSGSGHGSGWINEHFVNDGMPINEAAPGVPACSSAGNTTAGSGGGVVVASAPVPPTVVNGHNIGHPQNGWHTWGSCTVRDYKGGEFAWTIVSTTAGTHIVHTGMLFGWFDNGGGPGVLGCPTSDEYGWNYGVRQDFQHGSLYWHSGMDHAYRLSAEALSAISFAAKHMSDAYYNTNDCLQFVTDAYGQAGVNIRRGPTADYSASNYARYSGHALSTSATPPPGALVFWYGTTGYPDGHVALAIGGGYAISTEERQYTTGHILSISDRSSTKPYAGWFEPAHA